MDERAVNTTVGYVLTLGISSLLIVGLLVTAGGFVEDQRQTTVRQELSVVGQQVASDLSGADRLVRVGGSEVTVRSSIPDEVTGIRYRVEVDPDPSGPTTLRLSTTEPSVVVEVAVRTGMDVAPAAFDGGDLVVTWSGSELEVRRA
jgi:hypothetical protein